MNFVQNMQNMPRAYLYWNSIADIVNINCHKKLCDSITQLVDTSATGLGVSSKYLVAIEQIHDVIG